MIQFKDERLTFVLFVLCILAVTFLIFRSCDNLFESSMMHKQIQLEKIKKGISE